MTKNKARKRLVRQRTSKTGESYTSALRQLLANKEKSVTSTTQNSTISLCALCGIEGEDPANFVVAGLTFCQPCHERLTAAVRTHLEPEVSRRRRPLDYFVSALVFVADGDSWVVHLHTFQPGAVVGQQGTRAAEIRQSLLAVKGDDGSGLRLNIVPHELFGCPRAVEPT